MCIPGFRPVVIGNIQPFDSDTDEEAPQEGGVRLPQQAAPPYNCSKNSHSQDWT